MVSCVHRKKKIRKKKAIIKRIRQVQCHGPAIKIKSNVVIVRYYDAVTVLFITSSEKKNQILAALMP